MDYQTQLLVRTAQLYYESELNQSEIADILEVSRPTVSRLLDEARRQGVVEIIVHDPIKKNAALSNELRSRLPLHDALVIDGVFDYEKALTRCSEAALQLFYSSLKDNQTIGISWGSVPALMANMMEQKSYENLSVVQMVGCLGSGTDYVDSLDLTCRIARKLGANYYTIYAPFHAESSMVRDYLIEDPQIKKTLRKAEQIDTIITGIGSLDSLTTIQRAGYWNDTNRRRLVKLGAVGHLIGRLFDMNGNPMEIPGSYTIGTPLDTMRKANLSIGIAVSHIKATATLGAVRGRYINTLVIDEELATAMLSLLDSEW